MVARRAILLALVAIAHTGFAPRAGADPMYHLTALGTLPGNNRTMPNAINNLGQVVGIAAEVQGNSSSNIQSFLYSNGQLTAIAQPSATAINDSGQILFGGDGGINDAGQIAQGGTFPTGGMPLPLADAQITGGLEAQAINNLGQVVGTFLDAQGVFHPFLYAAGHIQDLGLLPGVLGARAKAINDAGQVVGGSALGLNRAFLYSGGHLIDLGTLGGSQSNAYDINNHGDVVGGADTPTTGHAFLYTGGRMLDLNEFIPPNTGWVLQFATGINDSGQIIGIGRHDGMDWQGWLLTPVNAPEPTTLVAIAALGAGCGLRSWCRHRRAVATAVFTADSSVDNAVRPGENVDQAP